MISLAQRACGEEQMDAADLAPDVYAAVLADLAAANRITLGYRPTLGFLGRCLAGKTRMRLLDVGFGQGDMLRQVAKWARRTGIEADLVGIDLNPKSAAIAAAATPPELGITWRTGDYRALAGQHWDVVISSLVCHHMGRGEIEDFLAFMEGEARCGWLINDLHRHRIAHIGFPILARAMGWHRIVREDGQLSIARSFRAGEWHEMLGAAGLSDARVVRRFPFRLCVERLR
jgi:2-polyprenyl-3-methyl-5-hydroxy-6-metoxy-1,4-benzoquinol methylase